MMPIIELVEQVAKGPGTDATKRLDKFNKASPAHTMKSNESIVAYIACFIFLAQAYFNLVIADKSSVES